MSNIINIVVFILVSAWLIYEYLIRGSRILLEEKEIVIFPYSIFYLLSKFSSNGKYDYKIVKQKKMVIAGIFISGVFFQYLS